MSINLFPPICCKTPTQRTRTASSSSTWEVVFTRRMTSTDPNDLSPVPTGIVYDPSFEWVQMVVSTLAASPLPPITSSLIAIQPTLTQSLSPVRAAYSPDGGTTVYDETGTSASLTIAYMFPMGMIPTVIPLPVTQLVTAFFGIVLDIDGTGMYRTQFGSGFGNANAYFVIARRRTTP